MAMALLHFSLTVAFNLLLKIEHLYNVFRLYVLSCCAGCSATPHSCVYTSVVACSCPGIRLSRGCGGSTAPSLVEVGAVLPGCGDDMLHLWQKGTAGFNRAVHTANAVLVLHGFTLMLRWRWFGSCMLKRHNRLA